MLEMFYARGMRGWGKQHSADVESAAEATDLKQSQIEVLQFSQLYTYTSISTVNNELYCSNA